MFKIRRDGLGIRHGRRFAHDPILDPILAVDDYAEDVVLFELWQAFRGNDPLSNLALEHLQEFFRRGM
jgi:hypothetical protein